MIDRISHFRHRRDKREKKKKKTIVEINILVNNGKLKTVETSSIYLYIT